MYIPSENTGNFIIATVSVAISKVIAFFTQLDLPDLSTFVMPLVLFFLGKGIDVCIRIYLAKRNKSE